MKNKFLLASMALLAAAGLASCVTDEEPKLQKPTEFVLNTPPMANQLYVFDCDSKGNSINDITFTVSQPNYGGVATTPTYTVQVARSIEDFAKWDAEQNAPETPDTPDTPEGDGTRADELPLTAMVDYSSTDATLTIDGEKFCNAVNTIYGLTLANAKDEPHPVAVRVFASIANASYADIWSNPIAINVRSYVKPVPDRIWIIGQCSGWNITNEEMYLEEEEIGSKIYVGDYTIKAGEFMFRFYDVLGNWDHFSIGSQVDDNPIDIKDAAGEVITELPEDGITLPCIQETGGVNPKGSWNIPGWQGGKVHFVVDLNNNTVTLSPGQAKKVYLVGAPNGWNINSDAMALVEREEGTGIYTGTIEINAGDFQFRFYSQLGDWETNSLGAGEPDSPVDITVGASGYTGPVVNGKGSWKYDAWPGGQCQMTLDLKKMEVTFLKL